MKKLMQILFFSMAMVFSMKAQWYPQLDFSGFTTAESIHFVDEDYGWAAGTSFFYTQDGGRHWNLSNDWDLSGYDVYFLNKKVGFIGQNGGRIRRTEDGGITWTVIQTPVDKGIIKLHFCNDTVGWAAVGRFSNGKILKTVDAGLTWQVIETGIFIVENIYFLNDSIGWVVGSTREYYGIILKTQDGGETFSTQYVCQEVITSFMDICTSTSGLTGWAVGYNGNPEYGFLFKTTNGGEDWVEKNLPLVSSQYGYLDPIEEIYRITFVNDTLGWMACKGPRSSRILLTKDGGETWEEQKIEGWNYQIRDLCMISETKGWAVAYNKLFSTDSANIIAAIPYEPTHEQPISLVYPNPSNRLITLNTKKEDKPTEVIITDIRGNEVFQLPYPKNNVIDISSLAQGIYFLSIRFEANYPNTIVTTKIIKQ
jgi:photosystem II stability/assembly factor-like uncharacterized protein